MTRRWLAIALCAALGVFATAGPAAAQGVFNMGMLTNTLTQGAESSSGSTRSLGAALRAAPRKGPDLGHAGAALTYRPDLAVRHRTQQQLVARLKKSDPATAAELQVMFARRDPIEELNALLPQVGLKPNALPDAMALYLVTAWYGVRGSTDTRPADYGIVRGQAQRALLANPDVAGASDAVKQDLAEGLLLQAVFIEQAVNAARKQPDALPRVQAAIGQGARTSFGLDLKTLQLGPEGLR